MGLYGTSQVVPWRPVVQWDGMDSRDRETGSGTVRDIPGSPRGQ